MFVCKIKYTNFCKFLASLNILLLQAGALLLHLVFHIYFNPFNDGENIYFYIFQIYFIFYISSSIIIYHHHFCKFLVTFCSCKYKLIVQKMLFKCELYIQKVVLYTYVYKYILNTVNS